MLPLTSRNSMNFYSISYFSHALKSKQSIENMKNQKRKYKNKNKVTLTSERPKIVEFLGKKACLVKSD